MDRALFGDEPLEAFKLHIITSWVLVLSVTFFRSLAKILHITSQGSLLANVL
jgi:hypothetical protein